MPTRPYGVGLSYVKGDYELRAMPLLSTTTFIKGALLSTNGAGEVIVYAAGSADVLGVAVSDSSYSYEITPGTNVIDVLIPGDNCEFEVSLCSDVINSDLTAFEAHNVLTETGAGQTPVRLREVVSLDADSNVTQLLVVLPREDGTASALTGGTGSQFSTARVKILKGALLPFGSVGSALTALQ